MLSLPPKGHPFYCDSITLKYYDLNESDRILVCFTKEYGLMRFIAKGARRPKSKLAACVEPLRVNQLGVKTGLNLHQITDCETQQSFPKLYSDYDRLTGALVMVDLIQEFCQEMDAQPELYQFLLLGLKLMEKALNPRVCLLWYEWRLLSYLGFDIHLNSCYLCQQDLSTHAQMFFHGDGFYCKACAPKETALYLTADHYLILSKLDKGQPVREALDFRLVNRLQYLMQSHYQQLAEKEIKTMARLQHDILQNMPATR